MSGKWDRRFLALAEHVAAWSKDGSTQVGSVIVDKHRRIVSTGYNGFPTGVDDHAALLAIRDVKLRMTLHAELNAILFAKRDLSECTIYVWPMPPCAQCAAAIIQSGIERIVSREPTPEQYDRWGKDFALAERMYADAGIDLETIDG